MRLTHVWQKSLILGNEKRIIKKKQRSWIANKINFKNRLLRQAWERYHQC